LDLFDNNDFKISAPEHPIHYTPQGTGCVLDTVICKNVRLLHVTVSAVLDSDHLQISFYTLGHFRSRDRDNLNRVNKITYLEVFQSVASELISLRLQTDSGEEADKAARDFTASIASSHGLSTSTLTLSDLNVDVPSSDRVLKHEQEL